MPRGTPARKRRSARRGGNGTTGVGKARGAVAETPTPVEETLKLVAAGFPDEAEYREARDPAFACGGCQAYDNGECKMFGVEVEPDCVCDMFCSVQAVEWEGDQAQQAAAITAKELTDAGEVVDEWAADAEFVEMLAAQGGSFPLGARDETWDSGAAEKSYELPADSDCYMWKDSAGDAASKSSYKLAFVNKNGGKHAVWGAITAIAGVLSGARGGVDIPAADKAGVKSKVNGYYAKARSKYNDPSIKAPWESSSAGAEEFADMGACANCDHMFAMHTDGGACSVAGCDCMGYEGGNPDEVEAAGWIDFERLLDRQEMPPAERALIKLHMANLRVRFDTQPVIPDMHEPGATLPDPNPSPAPPAVPKFDGQVHWVADFVPEGRLTDDFRAMAPGAISWRELPLTLMAMTETSEGGHIGAELSGRIDRIWRDETDNMIRGEGVFEATEYGEMIAGLVENKSLRGVSVDLAIHEYEVGPRSDYFDEEGGWAPKEKTADTPEPSAIDLLFGEDPGGEPSVFVVTKAVIGMVTVCPFPAFADSKIEIANSVTAAIQSPAVVTVTSSPAWRLSVKPCECEEGIVRDSVLTDRVIASAVEEFPVEPYADWFDDPQLEEPTALTITPDGRVFGHAWPWGVCHTGFQEQCVQAPHSFTGYEYFHLGQVLCEGGEHVAVGKITIQTGHAGRRLSGRDAAAHYDNTGTVVAYVRCGEDDHGGWVAGVISPTATPEMVSALRGATLSGDWRKVAKPGEAGSLELVALLAVNVPGFPVPRTEALVASGTDEGPEVLTLIAASPNITPTHELTEDQQAQLEAIFTRMVTAKEAREAMALTDGDAE